MTTQTQFDAIIFDLDGTLLDTLADIAAAGNHMLETMDLPPRPVDDYRQLAGQGARWLVEKALEPHRVTQANRIDRGVELLKSFQLEHGLDHTKPYQGIAELLDQLTGRNIPLAIFSNKPHPATLIAVRERLGRWSFAAVEGAMDTRPVKPDPDGALEIAQRLNIEPDRVAFIGDTAADMQTATRAGMFPVGVLWGFREEDELRQAGAKAIATTPAQILDHLDIEHENPT